MTFESLQTKEGFGVQTKLRCYLSGEVVFTWKFGIKYVDTSQTTIVKEPVILWAKSLKSFISWSLLINLFDAKFSTSPHLTPQFLD